MLTNLVGNAAKFTKSGHVEVLARPHEPVAPGDREILLEWRVSDTGIGIPADRLHALFDPFTQVDSSTTRNYGGTGLGLAICKSLVALMGGRIWVESVEGVGSQFFFTCRLGLPAPQPDEETPEHRIDGADAADRGPRPARPPLVLAAEDDPGNQAVLERLAQRQGWSLVLVPNGREAVKKAGERRFDIILMDVEMPLMDGYAATAEIRRREEARGDARAPIIALSANALAGDREKCLDAGMDDYLSKPFRVDQLMTMIERWRRA